MSGKHTPGPWFVEQAKDTSGNTSYWYITTSDEPYGQALASTWGAGEYVGQQEPNARLLSVAPDLLEAAQALIECDEARKDVQPLFERAVQLARAAIAKATGDA